MPLGPDLDDEAVRRATKRELVRQRLFEERHQTADDVLLHELRSAVLEVATRLESAIEQVIAVHFGRTLPLAAWLRLGLVARTPVPAKLDLFQQILESTGCDWRFPFVLPIVRELFEVRNTLAHAVFRRVTADGDAEF